MIKLLRCILASVIGVSMLLAQAASADHIESLRGNSMADEPSQVPMQKNWQRDRRLWKPRICWSLASCRTWHS